jgi:hypothetical protein
MRNLTVVVSLMSVAGAAWGQSTSLPTYWRYAHPSAKVLLGADLAAIGRSAVGQRVKKEFQASLTGQALDFLWSADQVLVSAPVMPEAEKVKKGDSPTVITLQGKFELAAIRKSVTGKGAQKSAYKGVELLLADKGSGGMAMALVSPTVLVLGDRASVKAAIDNHASASPSASLSALFQRASELALTNDLWVVTETMEMAKKPAGAGPDLMDGLESIEGGASLRSGLGLDLRLNAKSGEEAVKMGQSLQAMVQLFTLGARNDPEVAQMVNKLQVGIADSQVRVAVNFTQAELDRGITQMKAGFQQQISEGTPVKVTIRPTVKELSSWTPDKPFVVKIFNADGGTKEVQINRQP